MPATGSGTIMLRMLKPDPMPAADRDGQPYLKAAKLGQHAVLPLHWPRTSGDAGPYLTRMVFAGGWGLAVSGLAEEATGALDPALDPALASACRVRRPFREPARYCPRS